MSNEEFLEEELIYNPETDDWETVLVDKRTKKEVVDAQKELNRNLDETTYFPFRTANLEESRVNKSVFENLELDKPIGIESMSAPERKLYNDYQKRKKLAEEQFKRKPVTGRPTKIITEKEIRYSMQNSGSIKEAAIFLAVPRPRWLKYAKLYIDKETGKSLYELHMIYCWGTADFDKLKRSGTLNKGAIKSNPELHNKLYRRMIDPVTGRYVHKSERKIVIRRNQKIKLLDVLEGLYPNYDPIKLKQNLIKTGWFARKCDNCGYDKENEDDGRVPLILNFLDENTRNHKRENLEMLCFNCFFIKSPMWRSKRYYTL